MSRTQVYLGEDELKLLERASRDTGASRSELIRRAVRAAFGEQGNDERLRALEASAGSWRGHRPGGLAAERPLEDLARRGLVRMPQAPRSSRMAQVKGTGSVSDLVSEQRA